MNTNRHELWRVADAFRRVVGRFTVRERTGRPSAVLYRLIPTGVDSCPFVVELNGHGLGIEGRGGFVFDLCRCGSGFPFWNQAGDETVVGSKIPSGGVTHRVGGEVAGFLGEIQQPIQGQRISGSGT